MREVDFTKEELIAIVSAKVKDANEMLAVARVNYDYEFYNSAVNRLYYACFHIASAALVSVGVTNVKSHEGVRNLFSLHFIKSGKMDAEWNHFYPYMFSCRSNADYDNFVEYTKEDVEEMQSQCVRFVGAVEKLIGEALKNS